MGDIQNKNLAAEDSVTLVDLLVVVLRWRKFIVLVTAIVFVLAFAFFVLLPGLKVYEIDKDPGYVVQVNYQLQAVPPQIGDLFDSSVVGTIQGYTGSLNLVKQVFADTILKNNPDFSAEDFQKKGSLELYLRDKFIGKKFTTAVDGNSNQFVLRIIDKDEIKAGLFATALMEKVKDLVSGDFKPKIARAKDILDQSYKSLAATTMEGTQERIMALASIEQRKAFLVNFASNPDFPFIEVGDPVVLAADPAKDQVDKGASGKTMAMVSVLAALFGSILLAFVFEYIRRLRANASDMAKLREALKPQRQS